MMRKQGVLCKRLCCADKKLAWSPLVRKTYSQREKIQPSTYSTLVYFAIWVLSFLFIVSIFPLATVKADTKDEVKQGVLFIPQSLDEEILDLNGEWEFYWDKLYTPEDLQDFSVQQEAQFEKVPLTWSHYRQGNGTLPIKGYATYRLQLQFTDNEIGKTKALYIPSISSAYTLWIDGEERVSKGQVGKNRSDMKPSSDTEIVSFKVSSNSVELVMQISNYHQRKSGITEPILIGEPEQIYSSQEKRLVFRTLTVVSLVIIGLYHVSLFAFRRKEPSLIYFGIVCIVIAIRAILLEQGLAAYMLPFLNWEIALKLEYLGASLGPLFISLFTYTQFSEDMNRNVRNIIFTVMSLWSVFIIVSPGIWFTKMMLPLQIIIMLNLIYLAFVYIKAAWRRREGSFLNTFAISMLSLTTIHDILLFNNLIQTIELASVGLLCFLFTQSIILSKRYSTSVMRTEKLTQDLVMLNSSLEQQVYKRTLELEQTNKELQNVNQKLNEIHQSRSKWIRNISHEISTPLTNIRAYTKGMLDGVISNDPEYIQHIYDQSIYLSKMLHDLHDMTDVENGQIHFDLKKVDILEYMRKIFHKYKLDIEKQGIQFHFKHSLLNQKPLFVQMDSLRMEQVMVNLVNNARRFVGEDGEIIIEMEQEEEDLVKIKVIDNGVGLKEGMSHLVFNRFYKGGHHGKPHNGSGLGLAISKEIVEYHGGQMGVHSIEGKGSCFYFTLPLYKNS
ncbi:sensor histidine kinase [Bacillus sp. SD088]|uniref:sensor histidine kinase n=1 Tax=Bacillus sp. SD088 TaxID=2782012 RepID=UPI001A95A74B|nr:sensor histidine kinase [Bacillus sp. SD088]MBO0991812.1 sensor histidine kinase [Bacillus sp. SD088]